jgi:hypothetical protein
VEPLRPALGPREAGGRAGYDLALVTTYTAATTARVIERYARWSIEDVKQIFGAGQGRNRTANAVRRTIPFPLACQTLATIWYAVAGHDPPTSKTVAPAPLVPHQGPAGHGRYGRQAPPRHHCRQV